VAGVTDAAEAGRDGVHAADECGWCPLCGLVAGLRAENPEALAKVLTAAAAFAEAVRELFEPAPDVATPSSAAKTPRVQHIRLDSEAAS
jgi:hypothetical protein